MAELDSWAVGSTTDRKVGTEDARRAISALMWGGATTLGVQSGLKNMLGSTAGKVAATGTPGINVTVNAFQAYMDYAARPGAYITTLDATKTVAILDVPADPSNQRNDLIIAQQNDADYGDANRNFQVVRVQGTPSGSPVDPTPSGSPNYLILARVRVTAGATTITNAMIDDLRPQWVSALGGLKPVRTVTERATLPLVDSLAIYRMDRDWVEICDGAAWRVQGVAVCSSTADRDSAITDPYNGLYATTTDTGTLWLRFSGAWVDARTVGLFAELDALKITDKTVNNSTVLSNDNELIIPVVANAKYRFNAYLIYSSLTTADARFALTGPAGATAQVSGYGIPTTTDTSFGTMDTAVLALGTDWQVGGGGLGIKRSCIPYGHIVTAGTAGSITMQFAQQTAQGSNSVLYTGSWMTMKRVG